jgi:hypothetical protein
MRIYSYPAPGFVINSKQRKKADLNSCEAPACGPALIFLSDSNFNGELVQMISSTSFRPRLIVVFILIFTCSTALHAGVVDDIAGDFKPVSGYLVMPEGDEYIIDLDKTHGISTGDIFSVLAPGKKIVHPVTQKVLGTLEEVKGILKVSRIKKGFSFARPVGESTKIKIGDPIRRYGNLAAIFWDYTGKGRSFFSELQKALPDLKWQDYNTAQKSRPTQPAANADTRNALTFILTAGGLEVRDPEFSVLHSYDTPESLSKTGASAPTAAAAAVVPVIVTTPLKADPDVKTALPARKETTGVKTQAPVFSEAQTIANLPDVSLITDFIKYDDQLLMASTDGAQIQIFNVSHDLKLIASGAPAYPVRILSVKWWTPGNGPRLYLVANVWSDRDKNVRGNLFVLDGDALRLKIQRIPRILGTFDLNGDGWPETLLGQEFAGDTFFGRRLNELKLSDDKIHYLKPNIELPRHFIVLGSVFADLTGDGQLESAYIRSRILYIYAGKKRLYKSPKQMGGSLSFLTYDIDPTFKNVQTISVEFEISPVATDLDGDGQPELLAVASDRSFFGSLAISSGVKKSWLAIFKYKGGRFESGTLGNELDTPLQGLTVARKRVLLVATASGNLLGEGAQSHLISYSLAQ